MCYHQNILRLHSSAGCAMALLGLETPCLLWHLNFFFQPGFLLVWIRVGSLHFSGISAVQACESQLVRNFRYSYIARNLPIEPTHTWQKLKSTGSKWQILSLGVFFLYSFIHCILSLQLFCQLERCFGVLNCRIPLSTADGGGSFPCDTQTLQDSRSLQEELRPPCLTFVMSYFYPWNTLQVCWQVLWLWSVLSSTPKFFQVK